MGGEVGALEGSPEAAAETAPAPGAARGLPAALALAVAAAGFGAAWWLGARSGGKAAAFALAAGLAFGFVLQRSRFCFYCHARDWFERRDPRGLLAVVLAVAVGTVGCQIVLGGWLPAPVPGRLPPDAHIGPVSWALVLAGLAFGAGMRVSGSCISAHLYRLAEGSPVAPFALLGAGLGFVAGFASWNALYSATVATAPLPWLPHAFGYGGTVALQLVVAGGLAALLWPGLARNPAPAHAPLPARFPVAVRAAFAGRWPYWLGGLGVGLIGATVIQRIEPLGVTAPIGALARAAGGALGWIPARIDGLDGFAGCSTVVQDTWATPPNLIVIGLIAGAAVGALASGQFRPRWPTWRDAARGLAGGVLLGWGAMVALGCTIGTFFSGTIAGALSGWVFGASVLAVLALSLRARPAGPEGAAARDA